MNFYAGTSGYSYKEWKGKFYPEKLPIKQMLRFYGEHFQTVEINYTFRQIPRVSVLENWADAVPANFKFVLKAPRVITHVRQLVGAADLVSQFVDVSRVLGQRQGPLLFQLPPTLRKNMSRLRQFLGTLPGNCRVAFEFRCQSWFDAEVLGLLRDHGVAICIAEAENGLETPFASTADWGYLRLRNPDYDDAELKAWLDRIRQQKWRDVFVFFRHEDEAKGPFLARRFLDLANG